MPEGKANSPLKLCTMNRKTLQLPLKRSPYAHAVDLVDLLSLLGHQPTKVRNDEYWYCSPLRIEKTASFAVNRPTDKWYDHGMGFGGGVIAFLKHYYQCDASQAFDRLKSMNLTISLPVERERKARIPDKPKLEILKALPLRAPSLHAYLAQRCIPIRLAKQYCRQVHYQIGDKKYFGIGFQNEKGGWEIRNPYSKISSSPKTWSLIKSASREILVFEGFMDFLSYLALFGDMRVHGPNIMVLNSLAFFNQCLPTLMTFSTVQLFLDGDASGKNITQFAMDKSRKFRDLSTLYAGHKDLNGWWIHQNKIAKAGSTP